MAEVGTAPLRELVDAHRAEIKAIVTRHHGRSVAIFGSVARGDEGPHSDVDFLVEFEPGLAPSSCWLWAPNSKKHSASRSTSVPRVAPRRHP